MPVDIFIFSVYFPSTNYPIDEYKECLALLWALFETYCDSGLIIILGDLNGSLGLMEGSRPFAGPQNERGKLLLEFMENFTLFATNLDCQCTGRLETLSFDDGRHKSTVDYIILPKSFSHLIKASSVYLFLFILFQILETYIHAALHARWVLRCLKTAKYVQINETDKNLIHSKTWAKISNKTNNNIPLTVVSNQPLRLDMLGILSIS